MHSNIAVGTLIPPHRHFSGDSFHPVPRGGELREFVRWALEDPPNYPRYPPTATATPSWMTYMRWNFLTSPLSSNTVAPATPSKGFIVFR